MPRVIHFEIHADQPERAVQFYTDVFGWTFEKWGGPMEYWLITTGEDGEAGINGGLMKRQGPGPVDGQAVNSYVCTVDVPELDTYMQRAREHGGEIVVDKMPIPGVGWLAYAKDTDGNIFGMMQNDPNAA
jgi:predicted enzyme related to lactoylglutathione lyase